MQNVIIDYDNRPIELNYDTKKDFLGTQICASAKKIISLNENFFREYKIVNEMAQLYLIRKSLNYENGRILEKIAGIKETVISVPAGDKIELKICLKGKIIFKK